MKCKLCKYKTDGRKEDRLGQIMSTHLRDKHQLLVYHSKIFCNWNSYVQGNHKHG